MSETKRRCTHYQGRCDRLVCDREDTRCECYDKGCKAPTHVATPGMIVERQCLAAGTINVSRYDYEVDGDHFVMCEPCADDACESGVFSVMDDDDSFGDDREIYRGEA